ncbi:MAG: hypothetical protein P4L84_14090 [Isosphaeraceae bacterium]|nr:hypothetical protein [Isosphaeraceae bacterium]
MGSVVQQRRSRRDIPLEALQVLAELGVGLDDTAALRRVMEGLQGGLPKCCIAFALFYGRAVDARRQDLVAGYRTWMNHLGLGQLGYVPCPRCLVEGTCIRATPASHAVGE